MDFNAQDVPQSLIHSDIDRWKEIIDVMHQELDFFKAMLNSKHLPLNHTQLDHENLVEKLSDIELKTKAFGQSLVNFSNEFGGIKECEDLQCEAHYNSTYFDFKNPFDQHLSDYKLFKKALFSYLKPAL